MDNGSPEIRSFMEAERRLRLHIAAAAWIPVLELYLELAGEFADKPDPSWNPLADQSAFESQRRDAARAWLEINSALEALEQFGDGPMTPAWVNNTIRALERVALIAGSWREGVATLDRAWALLPGDLVESARNVANNTLSVFQSPFTWFGLAALGVGLVVLKVRR